MKKATLILGTATLFAVGSAALTGCGNPEQKTEETEQHEGMEGEMHEHESMEGEMHEHEGMKGEMSEIEITQCPKWKNVDHKHAAYVCSMWCEEGEKKEAGECPKCGMKLVKFEDVKEKHDMQKHGEKEHDMSKHKH